MPLYWGNDNAPLLGQSSIIVPLSYIAIPLYLPAPFTMRCGLNGGIATVSPLISGRSRRHRDLQHSRIVQDPTPTHKDLDRRDHNPLWREISLLGAPSPCQSLFLFPPGQERVRRTRCTHPLGREPLIHRKQLHYSAAVNFITTTTLTSRSHKLVA